MRKGQGLSITTIVVAAIALLILVVVVAVFTGQFGGFAAGIQECSSKGGICVADSTCSGSSPNTVKLPGRSDCSQNIFQDDSGEDTSEICCIDPTAGN